MKRRGLEGGVTRVILFLIFAIHLLRILVAEGAGLIQDILKLAA